MGSFFGHALPGTFFIMFATWWTIQAFRQYFHSMMKHGAPFQSSPTFTVVIRGKPRNVEAITVAVMTSLGIFVELVAASIKGGHFVGAANFQHSTMYFFFGLVGVLSLLLPWLKLFPNHIDVVYLCLALAYAVEGLLFKFHLYGRQGTDVLIHTLLVYSVVGGAISTLVEMRYRESVLPVLGRSFFTLVQGTWFWQAGFLLFNPFSDHAWGGGQDHHSDGEEHMDHEYLMLITCAFIWHMAAVLLLMLATGVFIGCFYRRRGQLDSSKTFEMERQYGGSNGYTVLDVAEETLLGEE